MANTPNSNPSALTFTGGPIVDSTGKATFQFTKALIDWNTRITNSLNQLGQLIGQISAGAVITGRTEGIGTTVGNINEVGVITPPGLIPATDAQQGAVVLPAGATSNVLGSASQSSASDFDPAGAAATAQSNAEAHADSVAATAQSNAETFASDASNISTGTLSNQRLNGISGTFSLAALTVGGTQGSITLDHGVATALVPST